ncbi:MAG: MotA/TolQ/ExbB proton channel family protein [Planctomycetota bacterium]|nr:MotA/TolQ/ExbB proton channel family protein [Planctomycetota bacterium]
MKKLLPLALAALLSPPTPCAPQDPAGFGEARLGLDQQLIEAVEELNTLRQTIVSEKLPLSRELTALERQLSELRAEYQATTRQLDGRTLDLSNLRTEIRSREAENGYLSNLFDEYLRGFESRLHITELQRYEDQLERTKLAAEDSGLEEVEVFARQVELIALSIERLDEALGGTTFEGEAVDASGIVNRGVFALVGPAALFLPEGGSEATLAEQRLGSLQPAALPFGDPADAAAAADLITAGAGLMPFDPTLGNALKIEATEESLLEHVQKGGAVMIPIFAMAGLALLFAVYKWLSMAFIGMPKEKRVAALLEAVGERDEDAVKRHVGVIKGPIGSMLARGVDHLREPRELVEEVLYEKVLTTRLELNSFLPFIAICAASAPLLGLLGTVTGIINTFKMITVFGSGDVKSLSGGISEALITTKFGLIVAIPSLLLHAFLSRKARRIVDQMEKTAVAFTNQLGRAHYADEDEARAARRPQPAPTPADLPHTSLEARIGELAAEQECASKALQESRRELVLLQQELQAQEA